MERSVNSKINLKSWRLIKKNWKKKKENCNNELKYWNFDSSNFIVIQQ